MYMYVQHVCSFQISNNGCITFITNCIPVLQIEELARLSLKHPVRIFVDSNMDTADKLDQEFIRIRPNRETDREAIVTGNNMLYLIVQ